MTDGANVRRRDFLKTVGVTGAAAGLAATSPLLASPGEAASEAVHAEHMQHPEGHPAHGVEPPLFFTSIEAAVVTALVDTLIPQDDTGPGGVEAGVPTYIDRQMAGGFGRGARMYLQGPFASGTPQQGYQLPLTPAELYRVGIADLNAWCAKTYAGKSFVELAASERAEALKLVEQNKAEFPQVSARAFFSLLLQTTMEGYFGDPLYGGNRDKMVWKMIGFPGAIGMYVDDIEPYRNKKYEV